MAGSWVSFENNTPSCKRAMRLSDEHYLPALGLLLVIVCWCDDNLTDGHITDSALRRIAFGEWRTALNALVEVEWLHETEDGYQVHDYTDWQRSSEQIKELSEKRKAAARARWASKGDASAVQDALQVHSKRSAKCNAQTESTDSTDRADARANFPDCMDADSWAIGDEKEFTSSATHLRRAIDAKYGPTVRQGDIGLIGAAIKAGCPEGCTGNVSDACCRFAIEKVNKAATLKTAASFIKQDRGKA